MLTIANNCQIVGTSFSILNLRKEVMKYYIASELNDGSLLLFIASKYSIIKRTLGVLLGSLAIE